MAMIWVSETFTSYQGTGHLVGERQHFIRFAGCGVDCPIRSKCDEPASLTRKGATRRDHRDLVGEAIDAVGKRGWLHITGGEPTDQDEGLQELAKHARSSGLYVHLQTSGVRRVPIQWDWLTVSPKVIEPLQTFGQEMIVIDDGLVTIERLSQLLESTSFWCYYLCPLWGRDASSTIELAASAGWMMSQQAHKWWGAR